MVAFFKKNKNKRTTPFAPSTQSAYDAFRGAGEPSRASSKDASMKYGEGTRLDATSGDPTRMARAGFTAHLAGSNPFLIPIIDKFAPDFISGGEGDDTDDSVKETKNKEIVKPRTSTLGVGVFGLKNRRRGSGARALRVN